MSDRKDDTPTLEELAAALEGVSVASSDVAACLWPECPRLCRRPGRGRGRPQMFCSASCRAKYAYRRGQLDHALTVVEDVADELAELLPFAKSSEAERLRQLVIEAHRNLEWQLARFSRDRAHRRRHRPGPADPGQPHLRALYTLTGDSPGRAELAAIEAEEASWRRFQLFWRRDDALPTRRVRIPVGRASSFTEGSP